VNRTWSAHRTRVGLSHESLLAQLPLEGTYILDAMLEDHILGRELILDFRGELFNVFALVLDLEAKLASGWGTRGFWGGRMTCLVRLLVKVGAKMVQLLFRQGRGRLLGTALGFFCSQPVRDPLSSLHIRTSAPMTGRASVADGARRCVGWGILRGVLGGGGR